MNRITPSLVLSLLLAACSGGGSSSSAATPAGDPTPGSVTVVLDTRDGSDSFTQFQVGGAALEHDGGLMTRNLLGDTRMLTFGDPSGTPDGLRLRPAPSGDYVALHLLLVPGSGVSFDLEGDSRPVDGPVDVRIPIPDGLAHDAARSSWIVAGHDTPPLQTVATQLVWTPNLRVRADGEPVSLERLAFPVGDGDTMRATARALGDAVIVIRPAADCTFSDDEGNTYADQWAFRATLAASDELQVRGALNRNGDIVVEDLFRTSSGSRSRLIGRIESLDPAQARFGMRVIAVNRRSSGLELQTPESVTVMVGGATIERPNGAPLQFADLAVGQLAKVVWSERFVNPDGADLYQARLVQIPGANGANPSPQWRGAVQSVDAAAGTLVLVPLPNGELVVRGQSLTELLVRVDASTVIARQGPGGWTTIELTEVQAGSDRVWVRGEVEGPAALRATRLRVRGE